MTPLRAKRILNQLCDKPITEDLIDSTSPYLYLGTDGGRIDARLSSDELWAIVLWINDPEGVTNA